MSRLASGPCRGSRRSKMALQEVASQILGVPWDPLGDPKIIKKLKKWCPKIDQISEWFKRASQSRFKRIWGAQRPQKASTNDSKMMLGSENTDFWESAYFIGPADARRASRSWKNIKNQSKSFKFQWKNRSAKKKAFWDPFLVVWEAFWDQLGGQEEAKIAKKSVQEGPEKHLEKKVSEIIATQLQTC